MIGAVAWREFFQREGIYERAMEDAGREGNDASYGMGKPVIYHLVEWMGDYNFA